MESENTAPPSTPPNARDQLPIFSDEPERRDGTPPSSPPVFPWDIKSTHMIHAKKDVTPVTPTRPVRNAFSVLGKRKALEPTTDNARSAKQQKSGGSVAAGPKTQMQMSLGQKVQKKCTTCGMEYTASSAEDRKLHDKYHKQNAEGYDVGKDFVAKSTQYRKQYGVFKGVKPGDAIVFLDVHDHGHRKKRGQAVLDIVQRELGAVPIPEAHIWDHKVAQVDHDMDAKYKAYLYVRGTKCVGFLLAQNIDKAYTVIRPDSHTSADADPDKQGMEQKGSLGALKARKQREEQAAQALKDEISEASKHPIQLAVDTHPAVFGVSRIWTSPSCRGQGIAEYLLNTAIKRHNVMYEDDQKVLAQYEAGRGPDGTERPAEECKTMIAVLGCGKIRKIERKEHVAFSQPTDPGAKLARKWYGKAYGWSVYF